MGCSGNKSKKPEINVIPVTGNPLSFITNTEKNQSLGLNASLFDEPDTEWEASMQIIQTQNQQQVETIEEAEEQQQPLGESEEGAPEEEVIDLDNYRFISKASGEEGVAIVSKANPDTVNFILKKNEAGNYTLTFENTEEHSYNETRRLNFLESTIEHYSTKEDLSAFNILLSYEDKQRDEGVLISMTFVKVTEPSILKAALDSTFEYLYGAGKNIAWNQDRPLDLRICQSGHIPPYVERIHNAAKKWASVLTDRLEINPSPEPELCPPFSDLNTQTIRHVQGWQRVQGRSVSIPASVVSVPNVFTSMLLDSDMFVYEDEWLKTLPSLESINHKFFTQGPVAGLYENLITHEIGHMLGLHHKFDGTPSIMSYEDNISELQAYDIEAVQALYPLKILYPDLTGP